MTSNGALPEDPGIGKIVTRAALHCAAVLLALLVRDEIQAALTRDRDRWLARTFFRAEADDVELRVTGR